MYYCWNICSCIPRAERTLCDFASFAGHSNCFVCSNCRRKDRFTWSNCRRWATLYTFTHMSSVRSTSLLRIDSIIQQAFLVGMLNGFATHVKSSVERHLLGGEYMGSTSLQRNTTIYIFTTELGVGHDCIREHGCNIEVLFILVQYSG